MYKHKNLEKCWLYIFAKILNWQTKILAFKLRSAVDFDSHPECSQHFVISWCLPVRQNWFIEMMMCSTLIFYFKSIIISTVTDRLLTDCTVYTVIIWFSHIHGWVWVYVKRFLNQLSFLLITSFSTRYFILNDIQRNKTRRLVWKTTTTPPPPWKVNNKCCTLCTNTKICKNAGLPILEIS